MALATYRPKRFETTGAAYNLKRLVDCTGVDRQQYGDRPTVVGGQQGLLANMSLLRVCTQITKGEGLHDQRSYQRRRPAGGRTPLLGATSWTWLALVPGGRRRPPAGAVRLGGAELQATALSAVGAEFMNAGDDRPRAPLGGCGAGGARDKPARRSPGGEAAAPEGDLVGLEPPPPPPRRRGGWQVARTAAGSAAPERQRLPAAANAGGDGNSALRRPWPVRRGAAPQHICCI